MSFFDDISDSDSMLPMFGFTGIIIIIFIIICAFAYCSENRAIKTGFDASVTEIGTCRDADCLIKVNQAGKIIERTTGSKVFVGDVLRCNESRCYKEK